MLAWVVVQALVLHALARLRGRMVESLPAVAVILSGMLMLRHLGEEKAADRLERAVATVIREGKHVTYDMKPTRDDATAVGTKAMSEAICEALQLV